MAGLTKQEYLARKAAQLARVYKAQSSTMRNFELRPTDNTHPDTLGVDGNALHQGVRVFAPTSTTATASRSGSRRAKTDSPAVKSIPEMDLGSSTTDTGDSVVDAHNAGIRQALDQAHYDHQAAHLNDRRAEALRACTEGGLGSNGTVNSVKDFPNCFRRCRSSPPRTAGVAV